jgi:adenylyltransferase/sulfurtransferase
MSFRVLALRADPDCPVCGEHPRIRELADATEACATAPIDLTRPSATEEDHRSTDPAAAPQDPENNLPDSIGVRELHARLRGERPHPVVLDVRTSEEWSICRIDGACLIPLHELPARLGELDAGREIVVYCHSGRRSAGAVRFLRERGFDGARNLSGGIDAWSIEVDPAVPRY